MEIFSRLPVKSIARSRCVSMFCAYVLRRQDFTDLFLIKSAARPQILLACENYDGFLFFSAHQPQNPDEESSPIAANHLTHVPRSDEVCVPINGLVCLRRVPILNARRPVFPVTVIYNPSTGESLTLPVTKTSRKKKIRQMSYLGYDPIENKFKVLSMTFSYGNWGDDDEDEEENDDAYYYCNEYQVLTLGTEKLSWRLIECPKRHLPISNEICINGVLYYWASVKEESLEVTMLVCFDIRSEKFIFMKVMETFNRALPASTTTLTNYNGKLGLLMTKDSERIIIGSNTSFELWVLENTEPHEWSKHVYILPPLWKNVVGETRLFFLGMIGTNEIVLSSYYSYVSMPFYIFYYNIEKKTITRLEIQGMEALEGKRCYIFLNHIENVKLIKAVN